MHESVQPVQQQQHPDTLAPKTHNQKEPLSSSRHSKSPTLPRPRQLPLHATILAVLAISVALAMAFKMPSFLARLTRPFSSAAALGISSADGGAAAAQSTIPAGAEIASVAAGCFWGVEHMYRKHFGSKGLYDARVGYIGGDTANPSYRAVCSGATGRTYLLILLLLVVHFSFPPPQ